MDLYTLVTMVDPHAFRSERNFKYTHIPRDETGHWNWRGVLDVEGLVRKIKPLMFTRCEGIAAEIPVVVPVTVAVELAPAQRNAYEDIRAGAIISLNKYTETSTVTRYLIIKNVMSAITRLKQCCDDIALLGIPNKVGSPKTLRLLSLLNEDLLLDSKVLAFTQYQRMAHIITNKLRAKGLVVVEFTGSSTQAERKKAVDEFTNNADCRIMVMTTAGSMGLNLQAGSAIILFDILWNPKMMDQFIGRVVRPGNQVSHVPVISLVAANTIEQRIIERNREKSNLFDQVMQIEDKPTSWLGTTTENKDDIVAELLELLAEWPDTNGT